MMFDGGITIGEVFKHISRNIWVQIKKVMANAPEEVFMGKTYRNNYVEFDVLVYDHPKTEAGITPTTVLGLREFCILFKPSLV